MIGDMELTEVMDAIYFASHQKHGWQDCLDLLSEISGAEAAQLLVVSGDSGQLVAGYQSRAGAVQGCGDAGDDSPALISWSTRHEIDGTLVDLIVQRQAEHGDFASTEKRMLGDLMPHIARAMRQEEVFRLLNDRQTAVHRQKQGAMLLLDGQHNVVFLSAEAESLLSRTEAAKLAAGRLRLTQRSKQAELEALIEGCFESRTTGMVSLKDGEQDISRLLVSTVQPRDNKLFLSHGLVAVFMVGAQCEENSQEAVIGQWLGLTESESRIASLIAQGRRPGDIAGEIDLSVHTVRHHVKNIYRKTGAHSQSQLTALVLNLPA